MAIWWAADGRILYAYREGTASQQSNYGVYSIQVNESTGKAIGQPQPVTNAEGKIESMSATSNGDRLVLRRTNHQPQAFIAEFDAASRQWKTPRRLTLDANANFAHAWTSDSKAVLFVSNRNTTWKLFKQAIDETTAQVLVEGRSIFLPRLSADGAQVLYLAASRPEDTSFPASLMSKPLAGGPPHLILQEKGIINFQCARSPSTLCILSKLVGQDLIFVSFDLEHGAGRELVRIPNGYTNWSLSPDGSKLAVFLDRHRVRFLSLDTGVAHDVSVKDWPLHDGDWSADGKSVFMPSLTPKNVPVILEVNESGKAKVVLQGNANTFGSDALFSLLMGAMASYWKTCPAKIMPGWWTIFENCKAVSIPHCLNNQTSLDNCCQQSVWSRAGRLSPFPIPETGFEDLNASNRFDGSASYDRGLSGASCPLWSVVPACWRFVIWWQLVTA